MRALGIPSTSAKSPSPQRRGDSAAVTIDAVGADGDGVATLENGDRAFFAYTLPGETVQSGALVKRGQGWTGAAEILIASPDRQIPPCPHFGACGGCMLQHWQDAPYAAWKSDQLRAALGRAGCSDAPIGPLARTPRHDRRRIDLAIERDGKVVRVGLHRHRGREVIDLHACLVIDPRLLGMIGALRRVLPGLTGLLRTGSAVANLLDGGIDLLLRTDAALSPGDRTRLTALATEIGACRISAAVGGGPPEPAAQIGAAFTHLAGVEVSPPPGAFLQASRAGEAAITAAVLAGLPERMAARTPIIELFAGSGTLSFALAERGRVVAYEGDGPAHGALRRASAGRRVEAVHRDLVRQPLSAKEFAGAAAIVLDPPYAGAAPQMAAIAASRVARVIYVSCNPGALGRDARVLAQAGYRVAQSTPVDQFVWSAAVESVTVFGCSRRP